MYKCVTYPFQIKWRLTRQSKLLPIQHILPTNSTKRNEVFWTACIDKIVNKLWQRFAFIVLHLRDYPSQTRLHLDFLQKFDLFLEQICNLQMIHTIIDPWVTLLTGWSFTLDQQPLLTDEIRPAMKVGGSDLSIVIQNQDTFSTYISITQQHKCIHANTCNTDQPWERERI